MQRHIVPSRRAQAATRTCQSGHRGASSAVGRRYSGLLDRSRRRPGGWVAAAWLQCCMLATMRLSDSEHGSDRRYISSLSLRLVRGGQASSFATGGDREVLSWDTLMRLVRYVALPLMNTYFWYGRCIIFIMVSVRSRCSNAARPFGPIAAPATSKVPRWSLSVAMWRCKHAPAGIWAAAHHHST